MEKGAVRRLGIVAALVILVLLASGCDSAGAALSIPARASAGQQATETATPPAPSTATATPTRLLPTATVPPADPPTSTLEPGPTDVPPSPTLMATATAVPLPPTGTNTPKPASTPTPVEPQVTATAEETSVDTPAVPALVPTFPPGGVTVNGHHYDAYIPAATKPHQEYHFTCEFDAAWVVFKTYGFDVTDEQQLAIIGVDKSIEPYWTETKKGVFIYGGDVTRYYSGDYKTNFLARTTGQAMTKVFEHYGLHATPVHDQASIEAALSAGELVWVKATADFKPGRPATWVMPDGRTYQTVLGNDHAVVIMGYNQDVVAIRDVLGPTSTNEERVYEYEIPWQKFMSIFASQSYDGLAVARPAGGQ